MIRWRGPPAEAMRRVVLDDLTAIFHRPSGITHLIVSPMPELLDALGDWRTLDELAADFGLGEGERETLVAKLDELVAAGLVEAR